MLSPDSLEYFHQPDMSVIRARLKTPQAELARLSVLKIAQSISDSLDSDIGQNFPAKEPRLGFRPVMLDEEF